MNWYIAVAFPLTVLVITAWRLWSLKRSLKNVLRYTDDLKNGKYNARVLLKPGSDLGTLAANLNVIAEKIAHHAAEAAKSREILEGVLGSVVEGILVSDTGNRIVLANDRFKQDFTPESDPVGRNVWEVVRNHQFIDFAGLCRQRKENSVREIEFPDRGMHYAVGCCYLENIEWSVFVLNDVTVLKNLEKIKADFISNLSHELRTPLTAVKGYLETLEDPGITASDRAKFLKIVHDNTERLTNIVSDLLLLADFEQPESRMKVENFDLMELAGEVTVLFNKDAERKGLRLRFTPGSIPFFRGDRFMIQQLLINLIGNGIRFTERGEVSLDIEHKDNRFYIVVSDTGIGIPESEIPRIFERFYTVDKARSRAQGGTGLGLSIVKHIVQIHRGEIKVESNPGEGTKFTVIFDATGVASPRD